MNLPVRFLSSAPCEPVISVDGAWGAPGLNLSHWPGNTTPRELKHDLSTGSALSFLRLGQARRSELAAGCTAIANNHVDTDGISAMYVLSQPEAALERAELLLAVAEAGDFFRTPSDEAFVIDHLVGALADPERSPWRTSWAGLSADERHQDSIERILALYTSILDGELEPWRELWAPALERLERDRSGLELCQRDDVTHLDLTLWSAPESLGHEGFAPVRHALFGSTATDRVLFGAPAAGGGTCYRFILSTLSWFELQTISTLPRPDLAALCAELNQLEAAQGANEHAWQAQAVDGASPELWYGEPQLAKFPALNDALRPSRLEQGVVRRAIVEALRGVWVFPG